jgi:hypothetical protein
MQFREQGKKIQCIRSTYDPASKRSNQKVIGTFDRWTDKLPSVGLERLTDAERQELAAWFEAKQVKRAANCQQWKVGDAPRTLADLAEALRASDTLTADHAVKIWAGMGELAKVLRKAGHPKPKRTGKVAPPGSPDLLVESVEPAPVVLPTLLKGV